MTTFHTIAIPHDDIFQGRLIMDVFALSNFKRLRAEGIEIKVRADGHPPQRGEVIQFHDPIRG